MYPVIINESTQIAEMMAPVIAHETQKEAWDIPTTASPCLRNFSFSLTISVKNITKVIKGHSAK